MKLEEVLPHLRDGGKVKAIGYEFILTLENIGVYFQNSNMLHLDFKIVKDPYKKEVLVKFNEDGLLLEAHAGFFPADKANRAFKVTIEEIE